MMDVTSGCGLGASPGLEHVDCVCGMERAPPEPGPMEDHVKAKPCQTHWPSSEAWVVTNQDGWGVIPA